MAREERDHRSRMRDPRQRARAALSITPLIDVVFQLLIYFLLTAGFVVNERHLRTEPAVEEAAAQGPQLALEEEPLRITLTRGAGGASISVDGALGLARARGAERPADLAALARFLEGALLGEDAMQGEGRDGGALTAGHPVRISADGDVPWEDVVRVFNTVVGAGYRSVAFGGAT
jgi:biopolymer transport protein ExbD